MYSSYIDSILLDRYSLTTIEPGIWVVIVAVKRNAQGTALFSDHNPSSLIAGLQLLHGDASEWEALRGPASTAAER